LDLNSLIHILGARGYFQTCGTLKTWKRVKDQSGNPKGFGFAEYADADSVLRALRVLGGEGTGDEKKDKGVVLPALEEGATGKKLIVKADENTRKYLDQYEASRPRTVHDTELDKNALLSVINVVEDMTKPQDRKDSSSLLLHLHHENRVSLRSPASELKMEHGEKDDDTDLPADLPPDQKDLIYREIAFFRERAAARERERQREEEERASRRAKAEKERERSHGKENRERDRDRDRQYGHFHQSVNFIPARESRRESYVFDDEEEEQRRQAKRKTEMEMAFKERERRWQHREETMATNRE
ncbi:12749_t:CDS:2, partial [Funneliformis caledonium]